MTAVKESTPPASENSQELLLGLGGLLVVGGLGTEQFDLLALGRDLRGRRLCGQNRAASGALGVARIDEGEQRGNRGGHDAQGDRRADALDQLRADDVQCRRREIAADADRRLAGEGREFLAVGAELKVHRFIDEAEATLGRHQILIGVDQDRIGRRHALLHGEGDQAAIDLDRLLELLLQQSLQEHADVEFGKLCIARPEGARGQNDGDASVRGGERLAHRIARAGHLDTGLERAGGARILEPETAHQLAQRRRRQADVVSGEHGGRACVEADVGGEMARIDDVHGQRRELETIVVEIERQRHVGDGHMRRADRIDLVDHMRVERLHRLDAQRRVGQDTRMVGLGTLRRCCRSRALGRERVGIIAHERPDIDDVELVRGDVRIELEPVVGQRDGHAAGQIAVAERARQLSEAILAVDLFEMRSQMIGARVGDHDMAEIGEQSRIGTAHRQIGLRAVDRR